MVHGKVWRRAFLMFEDLFVSRSDRNPNKRARKTLQREKSVQECSKQFGSAPNVDHSLSFQPDMAVVQCPCSHASGDAGSCTESGA